MKANELMIGDWVNIKGCKTSQIRDLKDLLNVELGIFVTSGVPLTEEILKANGFEIQRAIGILADRLKVSRKYYIKEGKKEVIVMGGFVEITSPNSKLSILPLRFVGYANHIHELQHALRLCGLNELADNFKLS